VLLNAFNVQIDQLSQSAVDMQNAIFAIIQQGN